MSERFREAARAAAAPDAGPVELLPVRLAVACQQVLETDGAGLSLFNEDFRVPLGASSVEATTAERLQFTAEQGPCWDAVRDDLPLGADGPLIDERWPQFAGELRRRTPYRSVASVPLRLERGAGGALDLYFCDELDADRFDLGDAVAVAAHTADTLNRAASDTPLDRPVLPVGLPGPRWVRGPAAHDRTAVWVAVGMLVGDRIRTLEDALAVLRAAA